jgi:hypothetical protein
MLAGSMPFVKQSWSMKPLLMDTSLQGLTWLVEIDMDHAVYQQYGIMYVQPSTAAREYIHRIYCWRTK